MASFEQIVDSLSLNIIVPKVVLEFPPQDIDDSAWLRKLRSEEIERERAFFDEWLDFFFVLSLEQLDEASADPAHPPFDLLSFLAHTQVSYDATYISPTSASALSAPRLGTPPRTTSLKLSAGSGALPNPPNLFPLNTPNPTPMATEQDRRYVRAEGVALVSGIWGEELDPTKLTHVKDRDGFALLWDETAGVWVAVYRMCVNVAFQRLPVHNLLLCLTASITVRERPVPITPARASLAAMFMKAGGLSEFPPSARMVSLNNTHEFDKFYHGLDEVNLLEGLSSAPTFANAPSPLSLPSTRIGAKIRRKDFALPSDPSLIVDESATAPSLTARATLRKSFRRTLSAVSGFRVRMRTVFVPYVLFRPRGHDADIDHALAAGHAEHTVMLCVELDHPGEAPEAFLVDAVDVAIGVGGEARVHLLPWCETSPQEIFPLCLGMHEQCNLLFAVELLSAPIPDKEVLLLSPSTPNASGELQRPVTITVQGRPFSAVHLNGDRSRVKVENLDEALFPTLAFPSRWNCVLDLTPQRPPATAKRESEVLPEPPTPFPTTTPRLSPDQQDQQNPIAGYKRITLPFGPALRSPRPLLPFRTSLSTLGTGGSIVPSPSPLSKLAYTPPSVAAAISSAPRTTYGPPPSPGIPPPASLSKMLPVGETDEAFIDRDGSPMLPPTTPAYPAYSKNSIVPATPRTQGPLAVWGTVRVPGAAVELPRSGGLRQSPPVPSPLALMPFSSSVPQRERIIISVGLQGDVGTGARRLVPYDQFALDIFVFNQSAWTRRFEVTFLERRRRRHGHMEGYNATTRGGAGGALGSGILPLESRIRVGPLLPTTCQSVRMMFLALVPGVHTIEALILTDTETKHALTLRASMDVIVHETLSSDHPWL